METYDRPEDLAKCEEMGKEAPELGKRFFDYYLRPGDDDFEKGES